MKSFSTGENHPVLSRFVLLLFSALLSLPSFGQEKTFGFRSYDLAQHGVLQLSVPNNWDDQMLRRERGLPAILLTPGHGGSFSVQITPLFDAIPPDAAALKSKVTKAAEDLQTQVAETTILIQEIKGTNGTGYYYSVTDRIPKPDEFKYMTKGLLPAGDLVLAFTILSNDGAESAVEIALKLLKESKLRVPGTR